MKADFLFELGTEELPSSAVEKLGNLLLENLCEEFKKVNLNELEHEKDWLTVTIYDQVFKGRVEEIIPSNKYKL